MPASWLFLGFASHGLPKFIDCRHGLEPDKVNVLPLRIGLIGQHVLPLAFMLGDNPPQEGVFPSPNHQLGPKAFVVCAPQAFLGSPPLPGAPQHPHHQLGQGQIQPDHRF